MAANWLMKKHYFNLSGSFILALLSTVALIVTGCATRKSPVSSAGSAVLQEVRGDVQITTGGSSWSKARRGDSVHAGELVRTGQNGSATINLGSNGGSLEVKPGSLLELRQIGPSGRDPEVVAILNVLEGRIVGDTKNPPSKGKVIVQTRGGTYEIR